MSYRRADSAPAAERIRERLAVHYGNDAIFMDIHSIPAGVNFPDHIRKAWRRASVLLVLIGHDWLKSAEQLTPETILQHGFVSIMTLVGCHYILINVADVAIEYLYICMFLLAAGIGIAWLVQKRLQVLAVVAIGVVVGVAATALMTVSSSARYGQPILPRGAEWRENFELCAIISFGFIVGAIIAQRRWFERYFPHREDWVEFEVSMALGQETPIIPILLDGASMPTLRELPGSMSTLASLAALEVDGGLDFNSHIKRLISAIDMAARTAPAACVD
jgi:TIR domain-containing protein